MIDPSYYLFVGCLLFLLLFSTKRDRASLWIILMASIVEVIVYLLVTRQIHEPWRLVIPGALETLTILALIGVGRNRTAYIQAGLLLIAWCTHLLCYADLIANTNLVYDHYEQILAGVAVGQLLGFHDTVFNIGRNLQKWFNLWADGGRFVSPASRGTTMVRSAVESDK